MKILSAIILSSFLTGIIPLFPQSFSNPENDNAASIKNISGAFTIDDEIYTGNPFLSSKLRITQNYPDYKPSWSPDGKWIVFFRIINNKNLAIPKWKTKICIVKPDGSGLRELTSGQYADYNPTWTRDGKNNIIINRYDPDKNRGYIYLSNIDAKPGEEKLISNPEYSEFGHCGLKDGRIIVATSQGSVLKYIFSSSDNGDYFPPFIRILSPSPGNTGSYELVHFDDKVLMLPNRVTLSPDEKHITFELDNSAGRFGYEGHPLVVADFNVKTPGITNMKRFYNTPADEFALYPSWTSDSNGIIFFAGSGKSKFRFYLYNITTMKIERITEENSREYKYFCGESSPK